MGERRGRRVRGRRGGRHAAVKKIVEENKTFSVSPTDRAFLRDRLGGFVETREGGVAIARVVGHLRMPSGDTLVVRSPKAPAASVLAWVAFVDPTLRAVDWTDEVDELGAEGDIGTLVVLLFLRELRRALARAGLPRSYAATTTTSSNIRGRIDFTGLIAAGGDLTRVPCTIWERRPISHAVRTLATAVRRIAGDALLREVDPLALRSATRALAPVEPFADPREPSTASPLARNELPFARAVALARMLLAKNDLGELGDERGHGFLINLETLFERTVAVALGDAGVTALTKVNVPYWRRDSEGATGLVQGMQLDVHCPGLAPGGVVVDAKYKTKVSSSNVQQVLTYCFALGAREAALIVPSVCTSDRRSLVFRDPLSLRDIRVHCVELSTTSTSVAGWRESGRRMVTALREAIGAISTAQGALHPP